MKILYVEDEIAHVVLTQRTLEDNFNQEFELLHAETISSALTILDANPDIDLVLTDLRLPDGTGLDLLDKVNLRNDPPAVVLVTGQGDQENAVAALKAGAADYLVKQSDYLHRLPIVISNAVAQNRLLLEQAALREAQVKYQALVEQTPAVVFLDATDELETTLYISPRVEELTGYTSEEWQADPDIWVKHLHPDDRGRITEAEERTHKQGQRFQEEYRFVRRDGRVIWIKEDTNLIRDGDGNPLYWQGILLDVTKEKASQAAIQESEERFRRIFHTSPIATCVVTLDTGKFIDANKAFLDLVGLSLENLIGQTSVELEFWNSGQERESFIRDLETNRSLQGIEIQYKNVPNGPKDTVAYYEVIELGSKPCVLAMFYDVTEQKKSRDALQAERDFALQVLNNMGQGLTVTTDDRRFEYVNPAYAQILGYGQDEIAGKTPADFTSKDDLSALEHEKERRNEGVISTYESTLVHKNGHEVPVIITGVPRWQNNRVNGSIAVITDLTDIKRAEESLARQVKELIILHSAATAEAEIATSEEAVIEKITNIISQIYSEVCGILLLNEAGDILTPHPSYLGADVSNWREGYPITEGITGKTVLLGKPLRYADVTGEPDYIEIASETRSELCVPIRVHKRIIGVLNVESKKPNAFDEGDERFLNTIAGGLGSALERIRLFEAEQRRSKELESLYQATKSLTQSLKPEVIAESLIATMDELLGYEFASIYLLEDRSQLLVPLAISQKAQNLEIYERDMQILHKEKRSLGQGIIGWVAQHGRSIRSGDVSKEPRYLPIIKNIESELCVPLVARGKTIGAINIETTKPHAYTNGDENLLTALANSAAIALENARLYNETQRRVQELEAINRLSSSLRTTHLQNEMLDIFLDETLKLLDEENGSVWLYNPSSNMLVQRAVRGVGRNVKYKELMPTDGIIAHVFQSGKVFSSANLGDDPLVFKPDLDVILPGYGGVCIPIKSTAGTLGAIFIQMAANHQITEQISLLTTLAEIIGNAIHRAELFEQSQEQIYRLTALRDIDSAIASSTDLRVTLNILTDHTLKHLKVDAVDIMVYHPELQSLTYLCSAGFNTISPSRPLVRIGEGLAGQVVLKGRIDHVIDLKNSSEAKRSPMLAREGFVTYIGVPLMVKGQIKGVFEIFHRSTLSPNAEWMQFLQTLAGQAAIAIDNSQLFDNLQRSNQELTQAYDTTLEGWARALELRDRETEGHTRRVTDLTLRLASYMGINEDEMVKIYRGVLLHDIGKMGVPDQILKKTGPLTEAEWSEMRLHPQYAFDLLSPITYLRSALDIPYCHHEHWDGSGYPRGLIGDQIPLSARIFSVVDIWDALLSDRPYRKAWSRDKVIDYIKDVSGTILDPNIVDTFLILIAKSESETG